jgi:hypothetical protein
MTTTINADTIVGGAVVTADASGVLALQAAGNTALTLNTAQAIGVGSSPSYGTSGQVLTSAGSGAAPTWSTPATTSPAGSTGQLQYNNAGAFGAISSGTSGQILTSAGSGAAPTWATQSNAFGNDISYTDYSISLSAAITTSTSQFTRVQAVALDATRELMLLQGNSAMFAVVYDSSTGAFGTAVLVRTANINQAWYAGLVAISSSSVLVCSLPDSTTSLETVVLSISGSTVTVNSAVATTLSAASGLIINASRLVAVGTSYVLSYQTSATGLPKFRAITVSGTTPTVGAELAYAGGTNLYTQRSFAYDSSTLLHMSATSTVLYIYPITVSGSTLTGGTQATATTTSAFFNAGALSTGRYAVAYLNTTGRFAIASVSAGVATLNTSATVASVSSWFPYIQVFSDKAFVLTGNGASDKLALITDSAGSPSVGGTVITVASSSIVNYLSTEKIFTASATAGNSSYAIYGISSGSPVLEKSFQDNTAGVTGLQTFTGGFYYSYKNAGLPISSSDGYCLLRTSSGKIATPSGQYLFSISLDGNYVAKVQQNVNQFNVQNDALSTAVCWGCQPSPAVGRTTMLLRKITLS